MTPLTPLSIVLRTVCGCERLIAIHGNGYPPIFRVPYVRRNNFALASDDEGAALVGSQVRVFERTPLTGQYGYPIYSERL